MVEKYAQLIKTNKRKLNISKYYIYVLVNIFMSKKQEKNMIFLAKT